MAVLSFLQQEGTVQLHVRSYSPLRYPSLYLFEEYEIHFHLILVVFSQINSQISPLTRT